MSLVVHYWGADGVRSPVRASANGGRFLDRNYWETDGKPIVWSKPQAASVKASAPSPPPSSVASPHVAFETWEARGETLESVEARIHDGAKREDLRARAKGYLETLENLLGVRPKPGGSVLEIGSGVGYILEAAIERYRPSRIIGLDVAKGMIGHAKKRLERDHVDTRAVEFVHYDGVTAPLPDESIDFVYSVARLQHAPRAYCFRALIEAHRLVKKGGTVCVHLLAYSHFRKHTTPETFREEVLRQIRMEQGHWHHYYTVEEIEAVLRHGIGIPGAFNVREHDGSLYLRFQKV